jgi:hypothetical protein
MDRKFVCPICQKCLARSDSLKRHMIIHDRESDTSKKFMCSTCHKYFTQKGNLKRHIETLHSQISTPSNTTMDILISKIDKLESELKEIKNKPNNQTLNLICFSNQDNYLDILTSQMGDFDQAIEYVKNCALSDVVGDCKLIEKIYKNQNNQLSFSMDRKKSKIFYCNDQNKMITENKEAFGYKLANNLQNTYLKGINHLITKNLDHKCDPNKFLQNYDLMTWNSHIYHLSDHDYHHKILQNLDIPVQ